MKKIKILDVAFDVVTKEEALKRILELLKQYKQSYAVTPNPEMLLEARKNHAFKKVLNSAKLSIPDGIGILWASAFLNITQKNRSKLIITIKTALSLLSLFVFPKFCRKIFKERVTGADLFLEIVKKSAEYNLSIFLLGGTEGVAMKVKEKLEQKFPGIKIPGAFSGSPEDRDFNEIQSRINNAKPDLLFVAYGAPKQELWIDRRLKQLSGVKFAMGVGGTFDFIAGIKKRSPRLLQKLGLEWLYRLIQEPSRVKRIINATIVFPCAILKTRFGK